MEIGKKYINEYRHVFTCEHILSDGSAAGMVLVGYDSYPIVINITYLNKYKLYEPKKTVCFALLHNPKTGNYFTTDIYDSENKTRDQLAKYFQAYDVLKIYFEEVPA